MANSSQYIMSTSEASSISTSCVTNIVSTGRPIFCSFYGDFNSTSSTAWHYFSIDYKKSTDSSYTRPANGINQECSSTGQNKDFYIAIIIPNPTAGVTYNIMGSLRVGSGSGTYNEQGTGATPVLTVFEI